jgi:hypothetical protein
MAGEGVVTMAGHKAVEGSEAARLLQSAVEWLNCATANEASGWTGWARGDRGDAERDIARALTAPGYVSAAGEVSGG